MTLPNLLADLAVLLNQHGPDAAVVADFIETHQFDHPEFVELAEVSIKLKRMFLLA